MKKFVVTLEMEAEIEYIVPLCLEFSDSLDPALLTSVHYGFLFDLEVTNTVTGWLAGPRDLPFTTSPMLGL